MKKQCKGLAERLRISPDKHRLIAVVGAGGKTTLIYLLAKEFAEAGYHVAVTTTTHMQAEGRYGFLPIGIPCGDGKIKGKSSEYPADLLQEYDIVLTEADGSKRLPLKFPAEHEPVIPGKADLVIGVAGASAIGTTFRESCHRYQLACEFLGCGPDEQITVDHLVRILTSEKGQKKAVECEYRYMINQSDLLAEKDMEKLDEAMHRHIECGYVVSLYQIEEKDL